jgi:hypothetical protein
LREGTGESSALGGFPDLWWRSPLGVPGHHPKGNRRISCVINSVPLPIFCICIDVKITTGKFMSDQSTHLNNLRLLVVDDDRDTRDILTLLFELEVAEIKCAACAQEAMEIIIDFTPDILISDISIDNEDGCWLLPKIRNSEVLKDKWVPAIAITGLSS